MGNSAGKLNADTRKISMECWKIAERAVTIENDDIFRGVWIIICMAIMAFGTLYIIDIGGGISFIDIQGICFDRGSLFCLLNVGGVFIDSNYQSNNKSANNVI